MNSQSGLQGFLFKKAVDMKIEKVKSDWVLESWGLDWVVDKVRQMLGGRVEFMMVGAAPIAPEVLGFFRTVFRTECIEAYGMTGTVCVTLPVGVMRLTLTGLSVPFRSFPTETTGGGCTTAPGDYNIGSVGGPSTALEIRLKDVPDMNYLTTDKPFPRGEICTRGVGVMREYLKEPGKTAETIDEDGFVQTGDIGYIDDRGRLWVFDRKKHVFKLSQGEYVAPEKVESVYLRNLWVATIYVYGSMTENELVAMVVPDYDLARKELGLKGTNAELAKSEVLKKRVQEELEKTAEQYGLRGFERVREIYLESELDPVMLTPTMKMKRAEAAVS